MMHEDYLEDDNEAPRQSPLYLLTGILLGLGLGLLISLLIFPVHYVDSAPDSLAAADKDTYRLWIAQAYQADADLTRARQRLALLGDSNALVSLSAQAQLLVSDPQGEDQARALAALAAALSAPQPTTAATAAGENGTVTAAPTASTPQALETLGLDQAVQTATQPAEPTATWTPQATFTPRSTPTLLPTLGAPFTLLRSQRLCDPSLKPGLMQIYLEDAQGGPLPGVQINVAWSGGLDSFYTGLYPSIDLGYADFTMQPDIAYSLRVGDLSETVDNLIAPLCTADNGDSFTGGLKLEFMQSE
jgi:hypothetical protein